jgi:hypothetical protein
LSSLINSSKSNLALWNSSNVVHKAANRAIFREFTRCIKHIDYEKPCPDYYGATASRLTPSDAKLVQTARVYGENRKARIKAKMIHFIIYNNGYYLLGNLCL